MENIVNRLKENFTNVEGEYLYTPKSNTLLQEEDLNPLLMHCFNIGISDIHVEGGKYIMGDLNGRLYPISHKKLNINEVNNLLKKIYDKNAITRINSIEAIDTNYSMEIEDKKYRFRVNAVGSTVGKDKTVQITIRTLPEIPPKLKIVKRGEPLTAESGTLALEEEIWENFCPSQGMVIVTGPTGSGKSTLLAAGVRKIAEIPNINKKIITYEAPIEFVYDSCYTPSCFISQTEIVTQLKTFHDGLESGMRRKPDIILIGEARDNETIDSSILASQTGHLVYTTSHTNGVAETMKRLINVFPENERQAKLMDLVDSMKMIIAQRLLKTVDGGRCAVKEFLVFDKEVKNILRNATPTNISGILDDLVESKRQRLIDDAYLRFKEGLISEDQFKECEKDWGKFAKDEEEIFDLSDEIIKYISPQKFVKEPYIRHLHCGIIIDKRDVNYGKIAFCSKLEMNLEEFINKTNCYIAHTFNEAEQSNKDIINRLKNDFDEKKKKNQNKD